MYSLSQWRDYWQFWSGLEIWRTAWKWCLSIIALAAILSLPFNSIWCQSVFEIYAIWCHSLPYDVILFRVMSISTTYTIPYHSIPNYTILFQKIPFDYVSNWRNCKPYHSQPNYTILYHRMPFISIAMWFHFIPYGTIVYHKYRMMSFNYGLCMMQFNQVQWHSTYTWSNSIPQQRHSISSQCNIANVPSDKERRYLFIN